MTIEGESRVEEKCWRVAVGDKELERSEGGEVDPVGVS